MTTLAPAFHPVWPNLQLTWDASSLAPLMECARKYQLGILEGWTPSEMKIDLEFGRIAGEGLEMLLREIIAGKTHAAAVHAALRHVLMRSWNEATGRPTLGYYEDVWRCAGDVPYKNQKGNKAKCPNSHKGTWLFGQAPGTCSCGGTVETANRWYPVNPVKDRLALIRLIYAYSEDFRDGNLHVVTVGGPDDPARIPLLEHHWQLPFTTVQGVQFYLCGNLDKVITFGGEETFISDFKTTKNTLGKSYFSQFHPNVQVGVYDMCASQVLPPEVPRYGGVMIEAFQCLTGGVRIGRQIFTPTESERIELFRDLNYYLALAKQYAAQNYWPMNRTACKLCQFKPVCEASPEARGAVLAANYSRSFWDPVKRERTETRGGQVDTGRGQAPAADGQVVAVGQTGSVQPSVPVLLRGATAGGNEVPVPASA